jgi:hypothetical protein
LGAHEPMTVRRVSARKAGGGRHAGGPVVAAGATTCQVAGRDGRAIVTAGAGRR